ncbi:MAG: Nif3-like dinuclear metal center hexameric protein [Lachnospiraceae bacterium]|jgi:dinuclear metal center YbgI/SA1388 family protein|nr:Nif3-like dinuclear metal center hexameric protein [Lachnospiraceae bacterium]
MIFSEVMKKLEAFAPERYALGKDNVGYQIGRSDRDITTVCIATDVTEDIISQAEKGKAEMLLAHHPIIFTPMTKITDEDFDGRRVMRLIKSDINFVAMHTNYDALGMGDYAASLLGLVNPQVLISTDANPHIGIGRVGGLAAPTSLDEYALFVCKAFAFDTVRVYGEGSSVIRTCAIAPGSCSQDIIGYVKEAKAELLLTGEIKYSTVLELLSAGICVIEGGHFATERIFVADLLCFFERELPGITAFAAQEASPFRVLSV